MATVCASCPRTEWAEGFYRGYWLYAERRDEGTGRYRQTWLCASVAGGGPVLFSQSGVYDGALGELLDAMKGRVDLCIEQGMVMR